MITRDIQAQIQRDLFKNKAIILIGARQVGKTSLVKQITDDLNLPTLFLNCDEPEPREILTNTNTLKLRQLIGENKLLVIDEAQRVKNIGLTLKLIVDNIKEVQVLVTGSSALEIANEINEPLTGRKYEYNLFPFSVKELVRNSNILSEMQLLEKRMIYGTYPDVINYPSDSEKTLMNITGSYLYKDILAYNEVRRPAQLEKLVQALALQIGSEVSYNELAQIIQTDNQTVERYIDLLEKSFVVFRIGAFSRNLRNEIKKSRKIYFFDNGIRNAVIQNFSPLNLRQDVGALWENYVFSERMKQNHYVQNFSKNYFWRTFQQQEIDMVEVRNNNVSVFEIKWNPMRKVKISDSFIESYKPEIIDTITPKNYLDFLL
ncbi:MAG TPA: ATP-binding protein [Paludibacter sp.]|nr:ATP-binding protein [Paludibacter sp.]